MNGAEFTAPSVEYSLILPLLIVFGAAVISVLVEAFAPRRARYGTQVVLTLAAYVAAFAATVWVATGLDA